MIRFAGGCKVFVTLLAVLLLPAVATCATYHYTGAGGNLNVATFNGTGNVVPGVTTFSISVPETELVSPGDSVTVSLVGLQYPYAGNLRATLSHQSITGDVLNHIGAFTPGASGYATQFGNSIVICSGNYNFDSAYTQSLWATAATLGVADSIPCGNYLPTTAFSSANDNLSFQFAGLNTSGAWTLTIYDDYPPFDGGIASFIPGLSSWELTIQTTPATGSGACSGYNHSIPGTVAQVTGNLTNFPVLISGTWTNLATTSNGGWVTNPNGYDICVSDAGNTTSYPLEIESYDGSTGTLNYWVRFPSLSASGTTSFLIWTGKSVSGNPSTSAVWDGNYLGVWHLPDGVSLSTSDSTPNGANGVNSGATATGGRINGAANFNGSSLIYQPSAANVNVSGDITIEQWIKPNLGATMVPLDKDRQYSYIINADGTVAWADSSVWSYAAFGNQNIGLVSGQWQHLVFTKTAGVVSIYLNGVLKTSRSFGGSLAPGASPMALGCYYDGGCSIYFNGQLDEVRISNTARPVAWTAAEFANQSSPGTFVTLAGGSASCAITTSSLPNGTSGVFYTQSIATSGCSAPGFSVASGLPTGLTISSAGTISGTPSTANTSSFTVSVTDVNGNTSKPLSITINAGPPNSIIATSGTPQSATIGTAFATPLVATVRDSNSNPVAGVVVTFTAPGSGASGSFAGGVNTATTNTSGVATSAVFTANATAGSYAVTAAVAGVATPASFNLTNTSVGGACSGFGHSVSGTVAQVTGNLANFPVLISGTWTNLATTSNGGWVTNPNGYDICVSDAGNTTSYPLEIESYDGSTGSLNYWVRFPNLSASGTTAFQLWAGKAVGGNPSTSAVWDGNYLGVWHLPNGVSLSTNDSTANGANGVNSGATATGGKVNGAANFSGSSVIYQPSTSNVNVAGDITVEQWIKPNLGATMVPLDKDRQYSYLINADGTVSWADSSLWSFSSFGSQNIGLVSGQWQHLVFTKTAGIVNIYLNGVLKASRSFGTSVTPASNPLALGCYYDGGCSIYFNGQLDEVRVSNTARSAAWMAAEFANQSSPGTFVTLAAGGGGACSGYSHSIPGTAAQVTGNLTNFPVLISGTWTSLATAANGGWVTNPNGYDICVSDPANTTSYPIEIESYNGSTGNLNYWVRFPSLSASGTTTFLLWAGKAVSGNPSTSAVWDSNYLGVWHLPNGVSLSTSDSSANGVTGVNSGATATVGAINGAANFNGSSVIYQPSTSNVNVAGDITVEQWIKPNLGATMVPLDKDRQYSYLINADGTVSWADSSLWSFSSFGSQNIGLVSGQWQHLVFTKTAGIVNIYLNGVLKASRSFGTSVTPAPNPLALGCYYDGGCSVYFNGQLDEVRISNIARPSAWTAAEFANQSSPGTFITLQAN